MKEEQMGKIIPCHGITLTMAAALFTPHWDTRKNPTRKNYF